MGQYWVIAQTLLLLYTNAFDINIKMKFEDGVDLLPFLVRTILFMIIILMS